MSYFGSVLLARSEVLLVRLPEVSSAFGSNWQRLEDRGDGWQVLEIASPFAHQWPLVGAGLRPTVAVTGAPALAIWVADTHCAQIMAAAAGGESWSVHLTRRADGGCGYDHQFATLRPQAGQAPAGEAAVAANLATWAESAGLTPDRDRITAAVIEPCRYRDLPGALVDAMELPPGREIPRLFAHQELGWWDTWHRGYRAGLRACAKWTTGSTVEGDLPLPEDEDFLGFVDQVARSMYGGGSTHEELLHESARLAARWR